MEEKTRPRGPILCEESSEEQADVRKPGWPGLPPRAIPGSVVLMQLGSVLLSQARVTKQAKWCLCSRLPPETMWITEGTEAKGHVLIRVACPDT